jgi:prophage maintenance system killer protein
VQDITVGDIEQIAFALAQELMTYDEPIPDYSTRFPGVLESCLAAPFQWFAGRPLHRGLISKSSELFYLMLKNHPFQNGNKRVAITTLLVFLFLNGKWLRVGLDEFYDFSIRVAESDPKAKKTAVSGIREFVRAHIVNSGPSQRSRPRALK